MGRMTVNDNPSPMAANVTWPDKEHVALARHAIENPYLVIPHPKNANHPLCVKCGIFSACTLVVPAPESIPEWPACKGMFPTTHCRSCATADVDNEYIFEVATCGCGVTRSSKVNACIQCYKEENGSKDCYTEGCGEKRLGFEAYCSSCHTLNKQRYMSCFLCGEEITRHVDIFRNTKKGKKLRGKKLSDLYCYGKDNMDCFRRCNAYEGGVRGGEGGNDGRCQRDRFLHKRRQNFSRKTCGFERCLTGCTLLLE
jgi:hypothetical protein